MRIIAGEFRGRRLCAPKGQTTRPTTDRVRESLMSALASARGGFEDACVLDAFAGSGALGLEALSRGAACAHFFEKDKQALFALRSNVEALYGKAAEKAAVGKAAGGEATVGKVGAGKALAGKPAEGNVTENASTLTYSQAQMPARISATDVLAYPPLNTSKPFDLVFLDPPYAIDAKLVFAMLHKLNNAASLAPCAIISYEHALKNTYDIDAALEVSDFELLSRRAYGETELDIMCLKQDEHS